MPRSTATPLDRQVARVRRRLFLQSLLVLLVWACVGALAVGVAWFLAQPYLVRDALPWYRWAVLGGAAGVATLAAVALAVWRAPSPVVAALSLDERFGLKERATTALTLPQREAATAAAAALRADVNARVEPLRVGDRFPLRLPRSAALVPAAALVLVLLAFFYNPLVSPPKADASEPLVQSPAAKAEIDKKMRELQKKARLKKADDRPKSKEMERLEGEVDRLAKKPLDTREQAREVVKDMAGLEEQLKKRDKQLAQKAEALKEQMQQVERLSKKQKKDGPAKELNKAMEQGDFKKAKDEVERLSKKMKEQEEIEKLRKKSQDDKLNEGERKEAKEQLDRMQDKALSREQKEQLEQQLKDLKDDLQRLSRNKDDEAQRLRDMAQRGELDKEQLQRELDQLEKNASKLDKETLDQLKELADQLGECEKCMKEGKDGEAGQKLKEAAAKLGKLDPEGEAGELAAQLEQLQAARRMICRALDQNNNNGPAAGRRPESKEKDTGAKEERARSRLDKGRLQVIDHVPGDGFKGPRRPAEMREEIRKASQEAPEAIDRQRLPRSASDMARGYFEKLRGPDGGKPAPKP
ncbi:MAG TPA: hypothetical protein VFE78_37395 [Gemmataceae bacterium]|jgi:hypothetical protein|nr:hypothetical protein [Gemmataceae bacterium]